MTRPYLPLIQAELADIGLEKEDVGALHMGEVRGRQSKRHMKDAKRLEVSSTTKPVSAVRASQSSKQASKPASQQASKWHVCCPAQTDRCTEPW